MCRWCGNGDQSFDLDGVHYDPCDVRDLHERSMFEFVHPHPWDESAMPCPLCNVDEPLLSWHHLVSDGMRWSTEYPAIRFTSEGLQTEETISVQP